MIKVIQVKDIGILICMLAGVMLLVLTATGAKAEPVKASWERPIRADGTPLLDSEISRYGLRTINQADKKTQMKYPSKTTYSQELDLAPGYYRFDMRTYLLDGTKSDWGEPVWKTVEPKPLK